MSFFKDLANATGVGALANSAFGPKDKGIAPLKRVAPTDLSPLRTAISNYTPTAPVKAQTVQGYQARDLSAIPEYQQLAQRTEQSYNKNAQGSNEALQRRFAAMGGLNSGAYIKQAEIQQQQNQEAKSNAMNDLGAKFAGQESERAYQSGEQAKNFNASATNQTNQFNAGLARQGQMDQIEGQSKIAALEAQQQQMEQGANESEFNAAMQQYQAKHSGGFLGAGGFLGTGMGA